MTMNHNGSLLSRIGNAHRLLGRSFEVDFFPFMEKESSPQLEHPKYHRVVSESPLDALNKLSEKYHRVVSESALDALNKLSEQQQTQPL